MADSTFDQEVGAAAKLRAALETRRYEAWQEAIPGVGRVSCWLPRRHEGGSATPLAVLVEYGEKGVGGCDLYSQLDPDSNDVAPLLEWAQRDPS
jgi:hypothetical protein